MRFSPASKQEWIGFLLFPFKAFAVIAPVWLLLSTHEPFSVREAQMSVNGGIFLGYTLCVPVFVLAALIQIIARQQRQAIVSLVFALAIMGSIYFLLPVLALART